MLALRIAARYLISKKSTNAINLIAGVSILAMLVGTAGLVLVLSVFNGFEDVVVKLFNSFDPDIVITAKEGKDFNPNQQKLTQIVHLNGVSAVSQSLEENALLRYGKNQYLTTLKGVDENYTRITRVDSAVFQGAFILKQDSGYFAVLGSTISQALGINFLDQFTLLQVYIPKKGNNTFLSPDDAFRQEEIRPAGSFAIQEDFDSKYAFVPIEFMRNILDEPTRVTSICVGIKKGFDKDEVQNSIQQIMGNSFDVKNRYQQNEELYKIMKTEKWAVFAILSLILIIAAFNIIGSLWMLVIEKEKDISILKTMGANDKLVQQVFLWEGILISFTGAMIGFIIAIILCVLQQQFGFLRIPGNDFVIQFFPVKMIPLDFLFVFAIVSAISLLASWLPARKAAAMQVSLREQ
jgi:lipoprotein-releasing system permease protein